MSLLREIVALVDQLQRPDGVSLDDLAPHFPTHTRRQVAQAIANAKNRNLLETVQRGKPLGIGLGTSSCTYGPATSEEPQREPIGPDPTPARGELGRLGRVSSVWDLGRATA